MGLKIDSYTLNDIQTPDGYFKNKTEPKMAESRSLADIATAERQRDAEIKIADAEREASKARLKSDTEIAEASRDKKLLTEQYRAEENQATVSADAAKRLVEIEKNKEIEKQNAELEIIKAQTVEKRLVAEIQVPTEAEKKKKEIEAEAVAQAAVIEAEAKAKVVKIEAEAEADAIRLKGEAEAKAIKAKALAEAEGLEAKAKAYASYNDVGKLDILAPVITQIGKANAEAMKGIDKVTIVGDGDAVNGYGKSSLSGIASAMQVIKDLTGVDPKNLIQSDYKKEISLKIDKDSNTDDIADICGDNSPKEEIKNKENETTDTK